MGTPPKSSEPAYTMQSPLLVPPSAPPSEHDHDHDHLHHHGPSPLPYHPPPPPLPEAHPLATVVHPHMQSHAPSAPPAPEMQQNGEGDGAQPVHVDAAARLRAERLAAERGREESAMVELAEREAIYQAARDQASLRQADYRGTVQARQGMQALAVDPNEHARATPPLDQVLPPRAGAGVGVGGGQGQQGGGGGGKEGYEIGQYRVETEGYKVAQYRSIYDKP